MNTDNHAFLLFAGGALAMLTAQLVGVLTICGIAAAGRKFNHCCCDCEDCCCLPEENYEEKPCEKPHEKEDCEPASEE